MRLKELFIWKPVKELPNVEMGSRIPILFKIPNEHYGVTDYQNLQLLQNINKNIMYMFMPTDILFQSFTKNNNIEDAIVMNKLRQLRIYDKIPDIKDSHFILLNDGFVFGRLSHYTKILTSRGGRLYLYTYHPISILDVDKIKDVI